MRQGLITSGLNHILHNNLNKSKSLSHYKEKIEKRINNRLDKIKELIETKKSEISKINEAQVTKLKKLRDKVIDLSRQETMLNVASKMFNKLLNNSEFSITVKNENINSLSDRKELGTVYWGKNNRSLQIVYDGAIDTLIHEIIHVGHAVNGTYVTNDFSAGGRLAFFGTNSEIIAWKVTYS